jgi:REP element-mobilizing transposase RayT
MRQPRFTYPGAFHHCVNRGHNGEAILAGDKNKEAFLEILAEKVTKYRMRLFAYCLMDNHYHLLLQNASGRMSDFFRNLNTHFAFLFRKNMGGKGYVFQSRFHSTLIEDDAYLKMAIIYVLLNPLRAGVTENSRQYHWSSYRVYEKNKTQWLDSDYVLGLFGGRKGLVGAMQAEPQNKLPLLRTPFGPVLGEKDFLGLALEKFERRHRPDAVKKRRRDDYDFDPVEKVIWEFERENGMKVDDLETGHYAGKRMRSELLVRLRDLAGLTYKEISEFSIFASLQYGSLRQLYLNARKGKDGK